MSPLPLLPDAILCALLLATSAWCALVHRRLRSLLTHKGEMAAFIAALGAATGRAEAAIAGLREVAADVDQRQAEQAEVARQRGADLARAIENGGRLARRLEADLDHGARTLAVGGRRGDTSAGSGDLLFERLDERAAVMVAQPALKLGGGELTVRLDHGPLAVHPLGLDRVQPRALARQAADQEATAAARGPYPPVGGPHPGAGPA